jgi:phospholipase/carboxylesterase
MVDEETPVIASRVVEVVPASCSSLTSAAETVIFLHGRGQTPDTVERVASAFAAARLIAPTGGVALRRGSTWFENQSIGMARRESVERAETRFIDWLDEHVRSGMLPWLCGFSNGGAFAGYLLMRHPGRFAGAALLSAPLVLPPWEAGVLVGKPVFYGRGTEDQVVPNDAFLAAEAYLSQTSGGVLTKGLYDIAHEIDPAEVRGLANWFNANVASTHLASKAI